MGVLTGSRVVPLLGATVGVGVAEPLVTAVGLFVAPASAPAPVVFVLVVVVVDGSAAGFEASASSTAGVLPRVESGVISEFESSTAETGLMLATPGPESAAPPQAAMKRVITIVAIRNNIVLFILRG